MNTVSLAHILIPVIVTLHAVESLRDEDIAKIFDERALGETLADFSQYPSLEDIDEFKERISTIKRLNNEFNTDTSVGTVDDANAVSKRPFCNGFTGCGRISHGKRSLSSSALLEKLRMPDSKIVPVPQVISKRPFCNGFFGCGNPGKRIVFRNANFIRPHSFHSVERTSAKKRFFCNQGAFGCANQEKRSPYRSWIERMKTSGMAQL